MGLKYRLIIVVILFSAKASFSQVGILDRLLNIGILEFTSSGTGEVDIRFFNIANPTGIKADIEAIIEQSHVQ